MPTLTQDEINNIQQSSSPLKVRYQTVTRLYESNGGGWQYTGVCGACIIAVDIANRTYVLRILKVETREKVWEQEIYNDFIYITPTPWLHCIETDDKVVGLSFADESEAKEFYSNILFCKNTPVKTEEEKLVDKNARSEEKAKKKQEKSQKKKDKFKIKKMTKFVTNMFKSEKDTIVVGGPRNFRHTSHIGWGQDGFNITDLPEEWKEIFKKAGVKKSELENKDTAQRIIGIITDAMYSQQLTQNQQQQSAPTQQTQPQQQTSQPDTNTSGGNTLQVSRNAPPPPPMTLNAPPPPPVRGGPPPPSRSGPPPPPKGDPNTGDNRVSVGMGGNFLEEIQQKSTHLNKGEVPDIKNLSQNDQNTLVDTLSMAMKQIRQDIEDSNGDEESGWTDSE